MPFSKLALSVVMCLFTPPPGWEPGCDARTWKLRVSARGLKDALVVFYDFLRKYLLDTELSARGFGPTFCVSGQDAGLFFVMRNAASRRAVW